MYIRIQYTRGQPDNNQDNNPEKIQIMDYQELNISVFFRYFFIVNLLLSIAGISFSQELKLRYDPASEVLDNATLTDITGNGYDATLMNGAVISSFDNLQVVDLGSNNGYADMGAAAGSLISELNDFSVYCRLFIPSTTNLGSYGNFVWTFANSNDILNAANGNLFFSARNGRYAISPTNYTDESGIQTGQAMEKGVWKSIIYTQSNGTGNLYYDGFLVKTGEITLSPSVLGTTSYNYLGRSCYASDAYLKDAKYADFRIYDGPLSIDQIEMLSGIRSSSASAELLVDFDFSSDSDTEGQYTGSRQNGAILTDYAGVPVLDLGDQNGYFDFSASIGELIAELDSFSVSVTLEIPESTPINENGNFIWTFANSDDMAATANGNMFFSAISSRYAITQTSWRYESELDAGMPMIRGRWVNVIYKQMENTGYIYIDSTLYASGTVTIKPKELGATTHNFLGRSCYSSDVYLKNAQFSDFRIYRGAIDNSEVRKLCAGLEPFNRYLDSVKVVAAKDEIHIDHKDSIRSGIVLPGMVGDGVSVVWTSSNEDIVRPDGTVFRPANGEDPITVTLTATLSRNDYSETMDIAVTVLPYYTDEECVEQDLSGLEIGGNVNNARSQLTLPYRTVEGSRIMWESDSPDYINSVGRILKLSPNGEGRKKVILTATATKGSITASRDFIIFIAEDEYRSAYLFTYFTGNQPDQEQIRFAISRDGYHYTPLNNGQPVINSADIAIKQSVRDPHILRCEDGGTFYMVVTDMRSSEGWTSNRGIVMLKSTDLVNWSHATVNFPTRWPDSWANVLRVWAPQTIYDPIAGKYMVYFSLLTSDGKVPYDQIYYCYANEDFSDLEGEPQYLFDRGSATIDGDIVFNDADSLFHLFYKNEGQGGICKVTAERLTPENGEAAGSQWSVPSDNLEQTTEAVEGVGVFRLINADDWIMMYDCYGAGHYQFCSSDDLETFSFVLDNYSMDARHGTSMTITEEEAGRLAVAFPSTALNALSIGARNQNIRPEGITIDEGTKLISIPLYYGVDLAEFDPQFYGTAGTKITPSGSQDFTAGDVSYIFTLNNNPVTYTVKPEIRVNPVIPDFHADPDVLYSEKTGLFYIYPTTDGYPGWGGYTFDVFQSPDLVNWVNAGTILDLSTSQVPWATGNAWAPCIDEVEISEGNYRYYFYFSGESNGKKIGVAVSDHPAGPFSAATLPMISSRPAGINNGQIIDGDVFTDPVSGKGYFYWGNGFMAVSELNKDMMSIKEGSTSVITPQGGTLDTWAYREGTYVFYRNGIYYFLWSVDDTGSPNYHVAYGTAGSPTGPIHVADDPIVIRQDPENRIYGTAHNSILKIPGRDEWYIVYHRINADYLNNDPGVHREVCIDRLYFNDDGSIQRVIPTQRGIDTIQINGGVNTGISENIFDPEFVRIPDKNPDHGRIVDQQIFNLSGQKISEDVMIAGTGIYIILNSYEDGSLESRKVLVNKRNFQ